MSKNLKILTGTFLLIGILLFSLNFISSFTYDWNFTTPSDWIYNSTEIVVQSNSAFINGTSLPIYSWWHLNENNGTDIEDSSGNSRNGTTLGNPLWVTGILGSSLRFNGNTQYVDFGNFTGNFERTDSFSVELWFKTSVTTSGQIIISKILPSGNFNGWEIYYDGTPSNNIYFDLISVVTTNHLRVYCSPSVVADGNWHHLVVTYDGSSSPSGVNFYFDGVQKTTGTSINNLAGSILTTNSLQLDGRNGGSQGLTGDIDEVVIYSGILTSDAVSFRYNSGNGTETLAGQYPTENFTIQPLNNFTFTSVLSNFTENATKTLSQIQYVVTINGTWLYWNGTSWDNSDNSWTQSNNVSDINSNIKTLGNSGDFTFQAILHSNDGTFTPILYNIDVSECIENWVENDTGCEITDNKTKEYYDSNNCGTTISLPADNGTLTSCDYCTPSWFCNAFDFTCENPPPSDWITCVDIQDSLFPTCCSLTGLDSDCNMTTPEMFNQPCGNLTQLLSVPSYPYVDLNVNYPISYFIYLDGVPFFVGNVSMDLTELDTNISTFNFSWTNSTQSYDLTLLFTEEGDYPFTIYTYYPYIFNLTGEFIVRQSFNVTFCGFKEDGTSYTNNFAYLTAEFTSSKRYYDLVLEKYLTPLDFKRTFITPVFHTTYNSGCGTFQLYEPNQEYFIRLFDGTATFQTTFSPPNITKTYGVNIPIGKYTLNGTSETYNVLFETKDIHQYRYLANWIFIILVGLALVVSIILFFVVPQIAVTLGLGFITMITLIRIILWFWLGY